MEDKKRIIVEDDISLQPRVDVRINDDNQVKKNVPNIPNSRIFEQYQKYQNFCMERDHVLTLRKK